MQKPALIIRDLSIHKMPGFPNGMETMDSLAKNINIIAGPNASGKSSTARMIQNVIWKQNIDRIRVETILEIDRKKWNIHIDNGYYSSQSNGFDETLPSIPPIEESKRYFLALHELIQEDDQNLATAILKEAIGGYDLQEAQKSLGFSNSTPNRGISEYKNFEVKRNHVEEIERKQISLQSEERKLTDLEESLEKAKEATILRQGYTYLIDFLEARYNKEVLEKQKELFPPQMSLLTGNEYETLAKLEKDIEGRNQEIARIHREKKSIKNRLSALQIPKNGFDKVVLDTLNEKVEKLADLERSLYSNRLSIVKNEEETKVSLHRLFSELKKEDLDALSLQNIHDLDAFSQKASILLYKKQSYELEIVKLKNERQEKSHTLENVHHGIQLLLNWFEKDTTPSGISKTHLWILFFLGLVTFVLTYIFEWIGVVGVLAMLICVLYLYFRKQPTSLLKESRISDFNKTGLQEPANWQEEQVSKRLEELHQDLNKIKLQQEIHRRLEELNGLLREIQPEFQELEIERQTWINKLSDIPELSVENIASYSGLYWFLKNLQEWQKHTKELEAKRILYEEEKKIYAEILLQINTMFTEANVGEASDVASAKAILKKMRESQNTYATLFGNIANLKEQRLLYDGLLEKDKKDRNDIYSRLNLEFGAKEELRNLLERKEDFQDFEKNFEQAKRRLIEKEKQLKEHSLFDVIEEEIPILKVEEAKERKENYAKLADESEDLSKKITEIKVLVGKERTGHELEVALTEKESALDALEEYYLKNRVSITGDLILNGLRTRSQENSDLKVLVRAKELFSKITHGHFELILDDNEGGSFRAKNTDLNQGLELSQLSSGTRIQLLIAVRLAFIESQETGVKLPIIADEVLANSDDLRARQIIEALVEISKEGRQVFYFTAQSDEVKKWQEYLSKHKEIESKTILLYGQDAIQMDYSLKGQAEAPSIVFTEVLSPENLTHEEYHEQLNPPKYNLLKDKPEKLHLSYIIDNNDNLYACLHRGIQYYGHLKSFIEHQGEIEGLTEETIENIDAKVTLMKSYQSIYQKGRAKPIDRAVLIDSGSVSDTFIDAVDTKLKELDHNPKKLLQALRAGEVPRFMRAKIDELEEFLLDQQYLSDEEVLSPEEINTKLHAILSRLELDEMVAKRFLDTLIR